MTPTPFKPVAFMPVAFKPASFGAPSMSAAKGGAVVPAQKDTTSASKQLLGDSVQAGILGTKRSEELWDKTMLVCERAFDDLEKARQSNQKVLQETLKVLKEMQDNLLDHSRSTIEKSKTQALVQADVDNYEFVSRICKNAIDRSMEASKQWIELQGISHDHIFGKEQKAIEFLFSRRVEEIVWLGKALGAVQGQETHMSKLEIEQREQQLKEESECYDQMIKLAKAQGEMHQKARELDLKEQTQKDEANNSRAELSIRKVAVEGEISLHRKNLDNATRIQMLRYKASALQP